MGSHDFGEADCWGPALVNDVQIQVKVKVPVFVDIPKPLQQIRLGKNEYEYDFALERRTIEAYTKAIAEEKLQASTGAAAVSATAAAGALKFSNVKRFTPNKTEPLQPQRTDPSPAAAEEGALGSGIPTSLVEPTARGGTPTAGRVVVAPAVVKDFDVPVDDPFDVAELNTINDLEELRDVLTTLETPTNVISTELGNAQENGLHEDGTAAEVDSLPVGQPQQCQNALTSLLMKYHLHNSRSLPGSAERSLDQTTKGKFGSLKDITFPQICPDQDSNLLDPKRSIDPPAYNQAASSAPSSRTDLRSVDEPVKADQTIQALPSPQLAGRSEDLINKCSSSFAENFYSPEKTRTTILPELRSVTTAETVPVVANGVQPPTDIDALITCAVEMGFSRSRAQLLAEATFRSGSTADNEISSRDREKIFITQLVNFSSLVDTEGVSEDFAKTAVIVSPNDLGKAWDFINIANELSEMGFSDSAVCSALLASNLDKISALQLLIGPDSTDPTSIHSTTGAAGPLGPGTAPHQLTNQHNLARKNRRKKGLYGMFSKGH
ncbi:hypothetical protein AAHC03_04931 [Spirometra sp. Aus1]